MKKILLFFVIVLLWGCLSNEKESCKKGLPDKDYGFLNDIKRQPNQNYLETIVDFRQFGAHSDYKWIRNSENLKTIYSSLKLIGLKKFISVEEFNRPLFTDHWKKTCWANKSLEQILTSLISSFSDTTGIDGYFVEFWGRRKTEGNSDVVLKILMDIRSEYSQESSENNIKWKPNPIIIELLEYENRLKHADSINLKEITIDYFKYLKSIQLYSSANNLVNYYRDVQLHDHNRFYLDINNLFQQIETDSVDCDQYWNWRHSAKWYTDFYDYGP